MTRSAAPSASKLAASIASWRDGSAGFFKFVADVQPHVPSSTGGYEPYRLDDVTRAEIAKALDSTDVSVACFVWPRRHGKTATSAMVIVWRMLCRIGENIAIVANSEKQAIGTAFKLVRGAFENTPFLKGLVAAGTIVVGADKIELPATGSAVKAYTSNPAALWGAKLTCAQISEIHAAKNGGEDVFNALAGSLLDSTGSLMLIDSTVSPKSSKLYELYRAATDAVDPDTSIAFSHIEYRDLDEACAKSPAWINPNKLRSLSRQMLPAEFALLHLNRWGDAANLLFPSEVLDSCIAEYPLNAKALAAGAATIVGGGLDRAFGGSRHGDRTVTACVVKTVIDDDEHLYVLDADAVFLGRLGGIKGKLDSYHRDHAMTRVTLESYGAQDVGEWANTRPYGPGTEIVHPSRRTKHAAFSSLSQFAVEGRLHIHPRFADLIAEMRAFEVTIDGRADGAGEASIPKFSHPRGGHDDFIHAVAWAAYSLRGATLNPYEIVGIHCNGRGADIAHCVLNGGAHVPLCGSSCRSMREAEALYRGYLSRSPVQPADFPTFVLNKVQNIGAHVVPR